jgi:hypothetical protein
LNLPKNPGRRRRVFHHDPSGQLSVPFFYFLGSVCSGIGKYNRWFALFTGPLVKY